MKLQMQRSGTRRGLAACGEAFSQAVSLLFMAACMNLVPDQTEIVKAAAYAAQLDVAVWLKYCQQSW